MVRLVRETDGKQLCFLVSLFFRTFAHCERGSVAPAVESGFVRTFAFLRITGADFRVLAEEPRWCFRENIAVFRGS